MHFASVLALSMLLRPGAAASPGQWVTGEFLRKASAARQIPHFAGPSIVLPLDLDSTGQSPVSAHDQAWYRQELLPKVLAENAVNHVRTSIFVDVTKLGPQFDRPVPIEQLEQTRDTALKPSTAFKLLTHTGIQNRLVTVEDAITELAKAGPVDLVVGVQFPWYPLMAGSQETREFWVRELQLDPLDLTNIYPPDWDQRFNLLPPKSKEAYLAFADASRKRYKSLFESQWGGSERRKVGVLEDVGYTPLAPLQRVGIRFDFVDFINGSFANRAWMFVRTDAALSLLQSDAVRKKIDGLSPERGLSIVFANSALYDTFSMNSRSLSSFGRRNVEVYVVGAPQ